MLTLPAFSKRVIQCQSWKEWLHELFFHWISEAEWLLCNNDKENLSDALIWATFEYILHTRFFTSVIFNLIHFVFIFYHMLLILCLFIYVWDKSALDKKWEVFICLLLFVCNIKRAQQLRDSVPFSFLNKYNCKNSTLQVEM